MTDKKPAYTKRYRVLKDFTDLAGNEHKVDDEIDLDPTEAQAHVNADKITSELKQGSEAELSDASLARSRKPED
jgi:hypothetical protein